MADEQEEPQAETSSKTPVVRSGAAVAASGGHAIVVAQPAPVGPALPKISRRGVVRIGFWSGMGAMLVGIGATILNSLWPRGVTGFGSKILVGNVNKLEPGQKLQIVEAKTWLVRLNAEQAKRNDAPEGGILALYQKCPHLGCTVPWRADYSRDDPRNGQRYAGWFLCPCHGSTYSDAGVRVFGPAPRSMDTFALSIDDGGNITVDTGKITPGDINNGQRAVLPG